MKIINELENFIKDELIMDFGTKCIGFDDDLINSGIIDSMGILKLVSFIEKRYHIKVKDEDIITENFRSINKLNDYIEFSKNRSCK